MHLFAKGMTQGVLVREKRVHAFPIQLLAAPEIEADLVTLGSNPELVVRAREWRQGRLQQSGVRDEGLDIVFQAGDEDCQSCAGTFQEFVLCEPGCLRCVGFGFGSGA